ncbi:Imm61 family immunity protein [Mycolicibacterium aubagnense]|uniref:Uncharacterized protein n=1 Tax=Mycolicibacterium aubagnense TaxID=319707 RepID=A0ABM7I6I4_9MYCO|nr:hypothetical protein C1S80_12085 [Mycolicibacterium aubagnense]BBX82148.1 hypothetical protein MAUB_00210 [Mycolicibacterium aubagnense]
MLADHVREDLDLEYLEIPWDAADVSSQFELSDMENGYRTLRRLDGHPVAAARDATLSQLRLVPLSHYLAFDLATLKRAFLAQDGAPLLSRGCYQTPVR